MSIAPKPVNDRAIQSYIAEFIRLLRTTDPRWFEATFTNGACYRLYEILHHLWPEAEAWAAEWAEHGLEHFHVYTRVGDRFYDIKGWHRRTTIERHLKSKNNGRFSVLAPWKTAMAREAIERRLRDQECA